jgi:hypothetical protein
MAEERKVTVRLDLKPGDLTSINQAFADLARNLDAKNPLHAVAQQFEKAAEKVTEPDFKPPGMIAGMGAAGRQQEERSRIAQMFKNINVPVLQEATKAEVAFNDQLQRQKALLQNINEALKPENIKRYASAQLDAEAAASRFARALEREKDKLAPVAKAAAGPSTTMERFMGGMIGATAGQVAGGGVGALVGGSIAGSLTAGGVAGLVVGVVAETFSKIQEAVGKFSPGTMTRFQYAWDDMMAAIGKEFVPAIEAATSAVRSFADVLAQNSLSGKINAAGKWLTEFWAGLFLNEKQMQVMRGVGGLATSMRGVNLQSSVGMAARPISFGTAEEAAFRVYQQAFQGQTRPEERSANTLDNIFAWLQQRFGEQAPAIAQQAIADIQGTGDIQGGLIHRIHEGLNRAARRIVEQAR